MKKPEELDALIDGLRAADGIRREAAIARLRVAGARALPRLIPLIQHDPDDAARSAALAALDGIDDRRARDVALGALDSDRADVAIAAARVLRGWVTHEPGTGVLDALTTVALDRARHATVRQAAIEALSDLPRELVRPILEQGPAPAPEAVDEPDAVREWLLTRGKDAPLSALHDAVVRALERERLEPADGRQPEWLAVRGAAHAALARRGSRVALYDLRDAFGGSVTPLPLDYLMAVAAIGDESCLEPMARAWAATPAETWWRERLSSAATEIVRRDRLSARNATLKRVRAKWDGFV